MTENEPAGGLRARSAARRRRAIVTSAMRLFAERGYEATTITDVAADAELARGTVIGYFPTKVDLATAFADDLATGATTAFAADPDGNVVRALATWLATVASSIDREQAALASAMYDRNPDLRALTGGHVQRAFEVFGAAIASDLGRTEDDPLVSVYGGALAGAVTSYLDVVIAGHDGRDLHDTVIRFLRRLLKAAAA